MWEALNENVKSTDVDRWRSILTDPEEVAWFAKNEEKREAEHKEIVARYLATCTELAPLATTLTREELASYLASNPHPENWARFTALVDPKLLAYVELRAEDIREKRAQEEKERELDCIWGY